MKHLKGAISVFAAAMLTIVGMTVGVSAIENPLPDQSRNGTSSIIVHKYGIDASYEASYEANGKEITDGEAVVGTKEDESGKTVNVKLKDLNPLESIRFTLERMLEEKDLDGNVVLPVEYEVDSAFSAVTLPTGIDGTLTFDRLEFGVYRITELANDAVISPSAPFYVSVPMLNPLDANEWLYDIHVYPKNEIAGPDIDKSVSYAGNQNDTADLTEQVKWIITSQIPADVAACKEYIITDLLDETLRYAGSPKALEVSYIDAATSLKDVLQAEVDYVLTYTEGAAAFPWKDLLEIKLTEAGRAKIAKALSSAPGAELPRLTAVFYTEFDIPENKVSDYLGTAIGSQAKLKYTSSANVTHTPESETPEIHTGGIRLKKVDPKGAVLGGAEFKIYRDESDAQAGINAIADPADSNKDWVVTSNATSGLAEFPGLAYGARANGSAQGDAHNDPAAETTYWIVEVKAPEDSNGKPYNLLKQPLEVTVNATSHDDTNTINVINSNFSLPFTGGAGTLLTTAGGLALLAIGLCFYMVSKKKRKFNK